MKHKTSFAFGVLCLVISAAMTAAQEASSLGVLPVGRDGKPLNLDFETGTLKDWTAMGTAFEKQPIRGDTVFPRRNDSKSQHAGQFWLGGFEAVGDDPQGTLTSVPFKVTHPFAAFLVAGGPWPTTRVELVRADTQEVIFKVSGSESENLAPVTVDLRAHEGKEIFIRIVDQQSGHWGHVNFDDFKFYSEKPASIGSMAKPAPSAPQPLDSVKHDRLAPDEAAKAMTVPEGFRVTLFAGEPDVKQPIAFAMDDRGRLWVAEAYSYPQRQPEGQGKDRIVIFEDSDGDGKHDKRTVFSENLNLVSGLEVGFGGVWVGAAPQLLFIPDKNADDMPDGPPQVLLDGWGYQDTHETLNTFTWGPDGWLYGCHGVFTYSRVGKPNTPNDTRIPINAGIWRYHPTKHIFEVFAEGTSNPWGIDFDEYGQCIIEACVIPHLYHVIQGGRYQRQAGQHFNAHSYDDIKTIADHVHYLGDKGPHAGNARSDAAGGGHAHAGTMIYLGDNWPTQYRGQVFMNNIHGSRINMDVLERRGSGYVGRHGADFLLANDRSSQILNLIYGPDGSVFMIDWYDRQQCHTGNPANHDRSNGRIFKISYQTPKPAKVDLQKLSDAELVKLQLHTNDWHVRHARRVLQSRGTNPRVAVALTKIATSHKDDTRRLRALWALHATGLLTEKLGLQALADASPQVRGWTIQLLCEDKNPSEAVRKQFAQMARTDSSPVVRLYLASALQRLPLEQRWDIAEALIAHAEDASDHNLPLMLWYATEPLVTADAARALKLARDAKAPRLLSFAARRITSLNTPAALDTVVVAIGDGSPAQQLEILSAINQALKGRRQVEMPKAWTTVSAQLFASPNSDIRSQALALALTFGDPRALDTLRQTLTDPKANTDARKSAIDALLAAKDASLAVILPSLLQDANLRGPALRALAAYNDEKIPAAILSVYPALNAAEKRDALSTLASRLPSARALVAAIRAKTVTASDLSADIVRQMRNLKDADLDRDIAALWGVLRTTPQEKLAEIAKHKTQLAKPKSPTSDLQNGRLMFTRACQQCHTLFDTGGKIGPDLTGSNRADLDYLLENILDPSAVVGKEYLVSNLDTKDGQTITGIVITQDENAVTIQTANEKLVIPRGEILSLKQSELSMMPEGLLNGLTENQISDLIGYLRNPAQVELPAASK